MTPKQNRILATGTGIVGLILVSASIGSCIDGCGPEKSEWFVVCGFVLAALAAGALTAASFFDAQ